MERKKRLRILILGSKEYPFGSNWGDDNITSGGYEKYVEGLVSEFMKNKGLEISIITRKFKGTKGFEKKGNLTIYRVGWLKGFFLRNISFNSMSFLKSLKLEFDTVISIGLFATLSGVLLKRFGKKFQLISSPQGIASSQPQYNWTLIWVLRHLERFAYKNAGVLVFLSNEEKLQFKGKLGILPKKYAIMPTGIDMK